MGWAGERDLANDFDVLIDWVKFYFQTCISYIFKASVLPQTLLKYISGGVYVYVYVCACVCVCGGGWVDQLIFSNSHAISWNSLLTQQLQGIPWCLRVIYMKIYEAICVIQK